MKIIQMIPANGWCALYFNEDGPDERGRHFFVFPLVAWVLFEEDDYTRIGGMDAEDIVEGVGGWDSTNFMGYAHSNEIEADINKFNGKAKTYLNSKKNGRHTG